MDGVTCVDTGYYRPALAACYLIEHNGQAAFVDTGISRTVPQLLQLLEIKQIARDDVAYVMPTHVHLDHAGGAGALMAQLPSAKLVIHPRGARHMIDPTKLAAGATAVYGEVAFLENFGELIPVAEERIIVADDGYSLDLNGRLLLFLDTPGHARHHYSIYDQTSNGFFTGDIFGLSYRELDTAASQFVFPTTTPVQFDPEAWHHSLDRLLSYNPERMFLAHYGMVTRIEKLAGDLHRRIDKLTEIAKAAHGKDQQEQIMQGMIDLLADELRRTGHSLSTDEVVELFRLDLELNAQGLQVWLNRNAS
ncbi:MAG TPA: MBL fold metallo-hydrolase [Gammaproteobacteria bacterium]|nr:MBL fold metallo-hydrolase [Gammaproteobacteria bacterium]